jgi:hypothetical protein
MTYFSKAFSPISRQKVDPNIKGVHIEHADDPRISSMVRLLDGGGNDMVRNRVIDRFAKSITRAAPSAIELETTSITAEDFRAKRDEFTATAIEAGLHTIASTMLYNRIVEIRASLFSNGETYAYPNGDAFAADLENARAIALHDRSMTRADMLATGIGSAGVLISADQAGYQYSPFSPDKMWAVYGDEYYIGDVPNQVDTLNLEHASIVVLELAGGSGRDRNYAAYMGRQEGYTRGRLVKYTSDDWNNIPDVGQGGLDWTLSGEWLKMPDVDQVANPLTAYQDSTGGLYEYPIITWQMDGTGDRTTLLPVTGVVLYEQTFELDVELSRIIEAGGKAAAGVWFMSNPKGQDIKGAWNEGMVEGFGEQSVSLLSHSASNAKLAMEIIDKMAERTASRYHVPGYMVATSESFQMPSGYALEIKNIPLVQDRKKRYKINKTSMDRKFEIEKGLINFVEGTTIVPVDAREDWVPNPLEFPKDKAEIIAWHEHLLKHNLTTVEEIAVEIGKADTVEAAENMIAENVEKNPAPVQPAQQGGRLGRLLGGNQ